METCPICLEDMELTKNRATLRCGHAIHTTCLVALTQTSFNCPCCRAPYAEMPEPMMGANDVFGTDPDSDSASDLEFSDNEDVVEIETPAAPEPAPAPLPAAEPPVVQPWVFPRIITRNTRTELFRHIYGAIYNAEFAENFSGLFDGLNIAQISAALPEFDIRDVSNMIYSMSEDGHVYTTCDDHHFRLTDSPSVPP